MDPATEAISNIASQGILGALCAILLLVTWRLYTQVQIVQKSRVEDAQKVVETLMTIQKEHTSTISSMTAVVSSLKESVERLDRRGGM